MPIKSVIINDYLILNLDNKVPDNMAPPPAARVNNATLI